MNSISIILQIIIGLGIYNVWFLRAHRPTSYRGKHAAHLKAEFTAYGLPAWSFFVIGFVKVLAATGLIIGIWIPYIVPFAALVLALLMLGAISMHIKVRDSFKQTIPALIMFLLSVLVLFLQ